MCLFIYLLMYLFYCKDTNLIGNESWALTNLVRPFLNTKWSLLSIVVHGLKKFNKLIN